MQSFRRAGLMAVVAALLLVLAACGSGGGAGGGSTDGSTGGTPEPQGTTGGAGGQEPSPAETVKVKAMIPFPNYVPFYSLAVAQAMGYFEEEGLDVEILVADGSAEIYRQVVVGDAEIGFPSPGVVLRGLEREEPIVTPYVLYQHFVFQMIVPEDSDIHSVADLAGKRLGLSTLSGGEGVITLAMLAENGLTPDEDVELIEVGEGAGAAALALQQGRLDAYISNFVNVAGILHRLDGLRHVDMGKFSSFYDSLLTVRSDYLEANSDVVVRFARAVAKGTHFGITSPEAATRIIQEHWPDQIDDFEASRVLLETTAGLFSLPERAEGRYGWHDHEVWTAYMEYLVDGGQLEGPVPVENVYTNDFIDAINDFDREAVERQARDYQ